MTIAKEYPHSRWVIGRSLIRTFLAGATKDAAICLVSEEQAQKKKLSGDLVLSKYLFTCYSLHFRVTNFAGPKMKSRITNSPRQAEGLGN